MIKYLTTDATACGDTVKTLIGTITLPSNAKTLLGAWGYALGGPGITTLENVTGIVELESPDVNIQPCQFPLEPVAALTGGTPASQNKVWPINAWVPGNARVNCYITMDMAQTVANTGRVGVAIEVPDKVG
jgi:hypothetical protein